MVRYCTRLHVYSPASINFFLRVMFPVLSENDHWTSFFDQKFTQMRTWDQVSELHQLLWLRYSIWPWKFDSRSCPFFFRIDDMHFWFLHIWFHYTKGCNNYSFLLCVKVKKVGGKFRRSTLNTFRFIKYAIFCTTIIIFGVS